MNPCTPPLRNRWAPINLKQSFGYSGEPLGPTFEAFIPPGNGLNMRILLAEDSYNSQILISAILSKQGYEVVVANDGQEAWDILLEEDIQLVLTDWMMPNMDGPALCRKIRSNNLPRYIYTIMLTGREDKDSVIEGMEAGADDFLSKPPRVEELLVRLRAGQRVIELENALADQLDQVAKAHEELTDLYSHVRKDLEAAASMQAALLPHPYNWKGTLLEWIYQPSAFVAGDMLGYFPLDEHHLGFYHLDVSGHGIPSALLSFTLNKVLTPGPQQSNILVTPSDDGETTQITPPNEVVAKLNEQFLSPSDSTLYFTMLYGILDVRNGDVEFCQAGNPSPIMLRKDADQAEMLGSGGVPVGMLSGMDYDNTLTYLNPGDRLFIYSDGITECADPEGDMFGDERFLDLIVTSRQESLSEVGSQVSHTLEHWAAKTPHEDDVTMLMLERQG